MNMLEDIYLEHMVKRKKTGAQTVFVVLLCLAGAVLSVVLFALTFIIGVSMQQAGSGIGQITSFVGLLLIAAMWYGVYLLIGMQNVEYEYILTNSELDIDKIMSKKGRKHMITLDFKNVIICASTTDIEHNDDYKRIKADSVINAVGDESRGEIYFADFAGDGGARKRVLFQPTAKMINSARKYNPGRIFILD